MQKLFELLNDERFAIDNFEFPDIKSDNVDFSLPENILANYNKLRENLVAYEAIDFQKYSKLGEALTKVNKDGSRSIIEDDSNNDSMVADRCTKAVGICNTFTSMIQAVVLASGFYNTTVQTTIDRIYDAIKAYVEANLANRP